MTWGSALHSSYPVCMYHNKNHHLMGWMESQSKLMHEEHLTREDKANWSPYKAAKICMRT